MIKVGIIGYGTIGKDVADSLLKGTAGEARLISILVRDKTKYGEPGDLTGLFTESEETFFAAKPDVVVECAGHQAVRKYGEQALREGADLIAVSVGAFADEPLLERILKQAAESRRRVIVPSAAIAGLDRIAAGSVGEMEEVTLITRKPPKAWYGTFVERDVDLAALTEPYCAFEGVARDSARLFPESVNVSAALSLAGIGFDATKVKVYVDPGITQNTHQIEARGKFGEVKIEVRNTPSPGNPKTGYIVAMSVIKTLRDLTSPFVIGV